MIRISHSPKSLQMSYWSWNTRNILTSSHNFNTPICYRDLGWERRPTNPNMVFWGLWIINVCCLRPAAVNPVALIPSVADASLAGERKRTRGRWHGAVIAHPCVFVCPLRKYSCVRWKCDERMIVQQTHKQTREVVRFVQTTGNPSSSPD